LSPGICSIAFGVPPERMWKLEADADGGMVGQPTTCQARR
jgi:hypothetical protein